MDSADAEAGDRAFEDQTDTDRDALVDTVDATDATPTESGGLGDAGMVHEGEWIRSPFSDFLGCTVEQPNDLSSVTRAVWAPCPGDDAICQLLNADYLPGSYSMKLAFLASVMGEGDSSFAVHRGLGGSILSPTAYSSSGEAVASWRYSGEPACAVLLFHLAHGELGLVLNPTEFARQTSGITQRVVVGTAEELLAGGGESYDLLFSTTNMNGVANLSFSESLVVADGQPGGRLYVATRPNGAFEEVPKQGGRLWGEHTLHGSELFAAATDDLSRLYVRHPDGTLALLKGDATRAEALPAADGMYIAWQEGIGGTFWSGFARAEVWAAPYTTTPASFQPYKAADVPNTSLYDFAFGDGWYVVRLETGGARFVHLADSRFVDIAPPQDLEFTRCVGIADGEAWFLMRASPGAKDPVTIARYDLASVTSKLP